MKRNYKILLAIVLLSATLFAFKMKSGVDSNPDKDKLLLELLTFVLEKGHYNPATIDDAFSKGIYKDYVQALDPSKRFFLQSDIDEFSKYETELDDELINKDLTFFNLTYDRLMKRMEESKSIYKGIMNVPFDYSIDESFDTDYDKAPYAKNTAELNERWRKQIKLSTLSSLTERLRVQENKSKGIDTVATAKSGNKLVNENIEKIKSDDSADSGKTQNFCRVRKRNT